jgi:hypothetical protein
VTALCGVCQRPMALVSKGRRMFLISCPAEHYRLPAPSTAKGAKWFYESAAEAEEAAVRLYEMMQSSHKERR